MCFCPKDALAPGRHLTALTTFCFPRPMVVQLVAWNHYYSPILYLPAVTQADGKAKQEPHT